MKKSTRKVAALSLAAMVALGGISACSPSQKKDEGGSSGDAKASITWDMWGGSDDDLNWIKSTAEIAQKQNPDIEIKTQSAGWNDYFTKLTTNMSSGNLACVTSMNSQRLSSFYQALSPLTDEDLKIAGLDKANFAEGSLDILTHDGKLYGLPYDLAAMMVYYNKDMFEATGTPTPSTDWNFDDFLAAAKGTTTDAHKGFGMALGEFQWMALPIAKSGTQPVDDKGVIQLDNPDFDAAAQWYADLVLTEKVADPVPSASEAGWGEQQYGAGNVAMAVDGTWNASGYYKNEAGFKAGATRLPVGDKGEIGLVLGSGFGISATCENREAALKVLGSLLSKEAQDLLGSTGRSYPATTASQSLFFESLDASYRDDAKSAFEAAFKGVQGQNTSAKWSQVDPFMQPNLVSIYTGQAKMSDVLQQAQKQFGS
ncbi:MAG: sugar ABC transporter substrate-binding protein [Actinomycetaceae bacterium]|nr:sugar ABC transporter substrate-binding protein [Actinomycetaceae bacterium]